MDSLVFDENQPIMWMYIMGGTVLVVVIAVTAFVAKTRNVKLNWYEQNVLDMSRQPTEYRKCHAFNRIDTEDERENRESLATLSTMARRKQSRIMTVPAVDELLEFHKNVSSEALGDLSNSFTIPTAKKNEKSMFANPQHSQLDRTLYQANLPDSESSYNEESIENSGSIKLALHIDPQMGLLTVSLKQAVDLPSKRQDDNPNPYFRVSLDVPESGESKVEHQSRVIQKTASPTIDEDFFFQTPGGDISQCRLEIMCYDFDQFSVDECIGYCWLTLGRVTVSTDKANPTVFWAEVLPYDENEGKGFGEVLFSLTYLSRAQRLTMNIFKARSINMDSQGSVSIRVSLLSSGEKRLKRKKTSSKKNPCNAQFNESLTFSVPKNTLCDVILEIEAINEKGTFGMASEVVGRMELPLHRCKELWRAIIREEKSQARWYSLEEPDH